MKRSIRALCVPLAVSLSLLLAASCSSLDTCGDCEEAGSSCENCAGDTDCQAEGGACEGCPGASQAEAETAAAEGGACAGCATLMAGGTGWCADCGKGYSDGWEVNCTKYCKAAPGSQPCSSCVK